jgi:hypothetical protein
LFEEAQVHSRRVDLTIEAIQEVKEQQIEDQSVYKVSNAGDIEKIQREY